MWCYTQFLPRRKTWGWTNLSCRWRMRSRTVGTSRRRRMRSRTVGTFCYGKGRLFCTMSGLRILLFSWRLSVGGIRWACDILSRDWPFFAIAVRWTDPFSSHRSPVVLLWTRPIGPTSDWFTSGRCLNWSCFDFGLTLWLLDNFFRCKRGGFSCRGGCCSCVLRNNQKPTVLHVFVNNASSSLLSVILFIHFFSPSCEFGIFTKLFLKILNLMRRRCQF